MKSRAKLLSALLLPLALVSQSAADAEDQAELTAGAVTSEGRSAPPSVAARSASMMGDVIFDHEEHADEMEIECVECHHETTAAPLDYPHEQYFHDLWIDCDACHRESGAAEHGPQSCHDCHDTKARDIADERLSSKVILHQTCWKCHEVETGAEASESCQMCHTGPDAAPEAER